MADDEREDERFGPYVIYERLGAGGMATVHRASIAIGAGVVKEVALKRLLPQLVDDKLFIEDFVREAKLAAQLDHPNIVHILELGQVAGTYFIAMELIRGQSLIQLMKKAHAAKRSAPVGVVVALVSELCDALAYASRGRDVYGQPLDIVHRDLTPSNLLVTDDGHLKIIDFGVAKALSGKFMTNTGLIKGKLGYMSPEAIRGGKLDARTDLFSIGVVAWELLTGRRLFRGINEYEVITKIQDGPIAPPSSHNPDCPRELDAIVLRALARPPDDRWSSATEMRRALDAVRRLFDEGAPHVAAWKQSLIPIPRTEVRSDSNHEHVERLSTADLVLDTLEEDVDDGGQALAEGSVRKPSQGDIHVASSLRARTGDPTLPATRRSDPTIDDELTNVDEPKSR